MKRIFLSLLICIFSFVFLFDNVLAEGTTTKTEESKNYLVLFKDEMIPNIGKKKKEILNEKKQKWRAILNSNNVEIIKEFDYFPIISIKTTPTIAEKIKLNERVEDVTEDNIITIQNLEDVTISAPEYETYWNYIDDIQVKALWNQGYYGGKKPKTDSSGNILKDSNGNVIQTPVKIAFTDSGIRKDHVEFKNSYATQYDCSFGDCEQKYIGDVGPDSGHGTHVAGLLAGSHDPVDKSVDVKGIVPNAKLYSFVLSKDYKMTTGRVISAFDNMINEEIDVLNISQKWLENDEIKNKITNLVLGNTEVEQGIVIVVAAGNLTESDGSLVSQMTFPGTHPYTLAVGNVKRNNGVYEINDTKYDFTTGQHGIDIVAPGYKLFSAVDYNNVDYTSKSGTSMATPVVAGIAALLREKYPEATAQEIRSMLKIMATRSKTDDMENETLEDKYYGSGLVQAVMGESVFNRLVFSNAPKSVKRLPNGSNTITTLQPNSQKGYTIVRKYGTTDWYEIKFILDGIWRHGWIQADSSEVKPYTISILESYPTYKDHNTIEQIGTIPIGTHRLLYTWNDWYYASGYGWFKPATNKIFENEFNVQFNSSHTYTYGYDSVGGSTVIASISGSQTVVANEVAKDSQGNIWYRVYTYKGWCWIKPTSGTYGTFDGVS